MEALFLLSGMCRSDRQKLLNFVRIRRQASEKGITIYSLSWIELPKLMLNSHLSLLLCRTLVHSVKRDT